MHVPYHHDAGHGWLAVPLESCEGLPISSYSFHGLAYWTDTKAPGREDGYAPGARVAYLEEDCDARLWWEREKAAGRTLVPCSVYHDGDAFVRFLPRFAGTESFSLSELEGAE